MESPMKIDDHIF